MHNADYAEDSEEESPNLSLEAEQGAYCSQNHTLGLSNPKHESPSSSRNQRAQSHAL
jgi:hypothetical protein